MYSNITPTSVLSMNCFIGAFFGISLPYTYFTLPYCRKPESEESQYYGTGSNKYIRYLVNNLPDYTEPRQYNIIS